MAPALNQRRLSLEQSALITKARSLGATTALPVMLSEGEMVRLICVILADTQRNELIPAEVSLPSGAKWDYYEIPLSWFAKGELSANFTQFFIDCAAAVEDFATYFKCLSELHKRRKKFARILEAQPLPTMLQVAPRALLEYGTWDTGALSTWLTWRKWLYDIDNRSAQETGYLFEPILASSLGGVPCGARNSPVKRAGDSSKGRQVDCIVGDRAYEFKLRVTIAASGQGRFAEEIAFANDCRASQFTPVLLVLDPTPNPRLKELVARFRSVGGEAHLGDDAWEHLETKAGPVMATFVEKYVRRAIKSLDDHENELQDLRLSATPDRRTISITIGDNHKRDLDRHELAELEESDGD
jgi:hypothetical protein